MLCWAFNANFTNASRRTTQESSFHDMHDMPVESPRKEMNCVTHVYAHCVTHVCAPCREGELQANVDRRGARDRLGSWRLELEASLDVRSEERRVGKEG